jgi:hypothetical protein
MNNLKRLALVVRLQILDVLEQKRAWLLFIDDSGNVKEQCSLGLVRESVLVSKGILLGDPGNRERLTREAGQQEIVVRPLNDALLKVPGVSGATDLGDGKPTLVLDLISLGSRLAGERGGLHA